MKHYSLLAKISKEHGGMTRASFRRSRALAATGESVEVLTFNMEPDLREVTEHVRKHGELGDLAVHNMHTDLCLRPELFRPQRASKYGLSTQCELFRPVTDLSQKAPEALAPTQDYTITEWADRNGVVRRFDLRDRNGALFFVDERKANTSYPRRLTVLDRASGEPVFQGGSHALQAMWLDALIDNDLTAITIDGVAPSEAFASYSRPHVLKFLIQHTIHQLPGEDPESGHIEPRVSSPLRQNRTFDGLITLTKSQNRHLTRRISPVCKTFAIPNVNLPPVALEAANPTRDPNLCVVISRLEEDNKRLSHILMALSRARKTNPELHAEFYGGPLSGGVWESLRALVQSESLSDAVTFLGHQEGATRHFRRAGFTALTSRFEGQSLVLVEAMAHGAIPISYDVLYGPSEIITDGENGFLVTPSDIDALASRMVDVSRQASTTERMRERAVAASEAYSPSDVMRAWLEVYTTSQETLTLRERLRAASARATSVSFAQGKTMEISISIALPLSREERKSCDVRLQAVDHHSLNYVGVRPRSVKLTSSEIRATFEIPQGAFKGLGRRDITAWARVSLPDLATDIRLSWDDMWEAWPARSPSGQMNIR